MREIYKFINGQWFDGKEFQRRVFYSVDGILTQEELRSADEQIDLAGDFVVPPFGDAHCHHFDSPYMSAQQIEMYLRDGIFYAKVLTNSRAGAEQIARQVNTPTSVDVSYAHGALTGNNSHPIGIYEALALGFYTPGQQQANADKIWTSRLCENDAYYIIDTTSDLESKWEMILAGKPDFIKVYLSHSEEYENRKKHPSDSKTVKFHSGSGLNPKLLAEIIAKAREAGLQVSVHIETAADYHTALAAGVDEMAHLPGCYIEPNTDAQKYEILLEDAKLTAEGAVRVIPTASLADYIEESKDKEKAREIQIRNLNLLKSSGVKFGIGADAYDADALKEAIYLSSLGVWNNLELLKVWCEDTPQIIFPKRKIGYLREGFEASFLVLGSNPIENFENVKDINRRFKQGCFIKQVS